MTTDEILLAYFLSVNVITFALYSLDKWKAIHKAWRIPELTLLLWTAFGGSFGAYLAMHLFRHKTKHQKFTILVPLCILLHLGLLGWLVFGNR